MALARKQSLAGRARRGWIPCAVAPGGVIIIIAALDGFVNFFFPKWIVQDIRYPRNTAILYCLSDVQRKLISSTLFVAVGFPPGPNSWIQQLTITYLGLVLA